MRFCTKLITLFFCSLLITGCGKFRVTIIDPEIKPYVEQFEQILGKKTNVTVIFHAMPAGHETAIGVCREIPDGNLGYYQEIWIDPVDWNLESTDDDDKRVLIFHELGHCVLHRGHYNEFERGRPISIMNWFHIGIWYDDSSRGYYDSELFSSPSTLKQDHGSCVVRGPLE